MDDDDRIPPHELEQLARSLSIDGSLGRHDAQLAAQALRRLARWEATTRSGD
jgi:hypothetical protein